MSKYFVRELTNKIQKHLDESVRSYYVYSTDVNNPNYGNVRGYALLRSNLPPLYFEVKGKRSIYVRLANAPNCPWGTWRRQNALDYIREMYVNGFTELLHPDYSCLQVTCGTRT